MKRNVGNVDRVFRGLAALAMFSCAVISPLPLLLRTAPCWPSAETTPR